MRRNLSQRSAASTTTGAGAAATGSGRSVHASYRSSDLGSQRGNNMARQGTAAAAGPQVILPQRVAGQQLSQLTFIPEHGVLLRVVEEGEDDVEAVLVTSLYSALSVLSHGASPPRPHLLLTPSFVLGVGTPLLWPERQQAPAPADLVWTRWPSLCSACPWPGQDLLCQRRCHHLPPAQGSTQPSRHASQDNHHSHGIGCRMARWRGGL